MKNSIKNQLKNNEAVHGCWLNMGSPISSEIISSAGFDWVLIDLEHGVGSEPSLIYQLQALEGSGTTPFVRTESLEIARVKRLLDMGAIGIMFPQIQNAEEAAIAISNMYYPPKGRRGLAKMIRANQYGKDFENYVEKVNNNLLGIIQIETLQSLKHLDEIAAIDGVDVLFLGPSDLSLALGILGQWDHPDFIQAVEAIGKAARKAGKAAGVLFFDINQYEFYYQKGFRFLASGSDMVFVSQGANKLAKELDSQRKKYQ
jgi:2-keto-3-deoxy-L-rhamnonate aldolase RhmA